MQMSSNAFLIPFQYTNCIKAAILTCFAAFQGQTALHYACKEFLVHPDRKHAYQEVVQVAITHDANLNAQTAQVRKFICDAM